MVRTQVCLEPEQYSALKTEAFRLGISLAELLRRIVGRHMAGEDGIRFTKSDFLKLVALGDSGLPDGSAEHDRALDEGWRSGALR